jgi:hypothetical protein
MCCGIISVKSQTKTIFSEKSVAEFANYLYKTNQYSFASEEYERLVFNFPEKNEYKLKLVNTYRLAQEYDKGISTCWNYINQNTTYSELFITEYTKLSFLTGNYSNVSMLLRTINLEDSLRNNIDLASRIIFLDRKEISLENIDQNMVDYKLLDFYYQLDKVKRKSPFVAGFMSTVVPGSGKFYTNRWKDGVVALIFVGITGYQSYRGFSQKGVTSAYGWIMGGLSASFYLGNIFGSAKSANVYNQHQHNHYVENVSNYFIEHY